MNLNKYISNYLDKRKGYVDSIDLYPFFLSHNKIDTNFVFKAADKYHFISNVDNDQFQLIGYRVLTEDLYNLFIEDSRFLDIRGLVFIDGKLISRPYSKSFNIKEIMDRYPDFNIQDLDPDRIIFTEKLDGVMISAFLYEDTIYYTSKFKMDSDFAIMAKEMGPDQMVRDLGELGFCCLFELILPDFPIVIKYESPRLMLHGIRRISDGLLLEYEQICEIADQYNCPVVPEVYNVPEYLNGYVEGAVMHYSGNDFDIQIKYKSEFYLNNYKVLAAIRNVGHNTLRPILQVICDGTYDNLNVLLTLDEIRYVKKLRNFYLRSIESRFSEYIKKDKYFPEDDSLSLDTFSTRFFKEFPQLVVADVSNELKKPVESKSRNEKRIETKKSKKTQSTMNMNKMVKFMEQFE